MRLQAIEIKGFKSFYHKTRIEFPEGIISIVGPNGSGKSNILDAFRWVLGEQSVKNLRGEKMEDVIFSGTKKHGQSNFCEVEITLDNADHGLDIDYSEVSVKRRTHRDGETKYYINGKLCRLRDVRELFMDSGIGKEGYSIISQGKIDEIIQSNSSQRRKLLEEASGISKYRYKKEESERMIGEAKSNLERLEDVFAEIERQIIPLSEQKEKALEHIQVKEQLKKADVSLLIAEHNRNQEIIDEDITQRLENEAQLHRIIEEIEQCQMESERLNTESREATARLQELRENDHRLSFEKSNLSNEILRQQEKIQFKKALLDKSNAERAQITELQGQLNREREEIESENAALEHALRSHQRNIQDLERDQQSCRQKIESLEAERISAQQQFAVDQERLSVQQAKLIKDEQQLAWREQQSQEASERKARLDQTIQSLRERMQLVEAECGEQQVRVARIADNQQCLEKERMELEKEREALDFELREQNQIIRDLRSKQSVYQRMESDMEGYNKSVKTVLSNRNLSGIIDVVSNVVRTDPKYERAVEIALGSQMQHIITTDREAAKRAISYLKSTKAGRATFLPLDAIEASPLHTKEIRVSDVVQCEERFRTVVDFLLGRTIIAENMEHGIALAKQYHNRNRIVTLEGELFNPGGSVTGGHYYKSNELLSRRRILHEIVDQLREAEHHDRNLQIKREGIQERRELHQRMQIDCQKEMIEHQKLLDQCKQQHLELSNKIEWTESEKRLILEQQRDEASERVTREGIEREKEAYEYAKKKLNMQQQSIDQGKEELAKLHAQHTKLQDRDHQLKLEGLSLESKRERIRGERMRQEQRSAELNVRLSGVKQEVLGIHEEIRAVERVIEDATMSLQLFDVERDESAAEFDEQESQVRRLQDQIKKVDQQIRCLEQKRIEEMEAGYKFEGKLQRAKLILEQIVQRLSDDYALSWQEALQIERISTTKEAVSKLRSKLAQIGSVNIAAIQEYDLLSERYETYRTQIDDLQRSIEHLEQIIRELERDMAKDFGKYFAIINDNFGRIFQKLFGGGEAYLSLSNPQDILNTEIDIFAQPAGKRLKSISVLSGGEKALMGIAMLFAIQMTKPAPFCILDEIDAALDDQNIMRFNAFLTEMSQDIQFVTITHRRGTMETSDYIYGVTMQDKGVSNVVSIRFEEATAFIEQ